MSKQSDYSQEVLAADADAALGEVSRSNDAVGLVDAWIGAGNAAAVQEVAERGSGQARKAARRGLNVLKSRGVVIPPRRKPQAAMATAPAVEALLVPPDGSGAALFVLYQPNVSGRCTACFVHVVEGRGVSRVERGESTPSKLKSALSRGGSGLGGKAVSVPVGWARYRVAEARKLHQGSRIPEPLGFDSSKDLLEPVPDTAPEHPFDAEGFEFADEDARELASDSGSLHHLPEFGSWLPAQAAMAEMLRQVGGQIGEQGEDGDQVAQENVSEYLKTAMLDATDRYFTEEVRLALATRMKDVALSVLAHHGESEAMKVAATIQVVRSCGLVTNPPRDVPFLRAFFEKAIAVLSMQQGGQLKIPVPPRPPATAPAETAG